VLEGCVSENGAVRVVRRRRRARRGGSGDDKREQRGDEAHRSELRQPNDGAAPSKGGTVALGEDHGATGFLLHLRVDVAAEEVGIA
jgi:hypothetical protein